MDEARATAFIPSQATKAPFGWCRGWGRRDKTEGMTRDTLNMPPDARTTEHRRVDGPSLAGPACRSAATLHPTALSLSLDTPQIHG